jgi:hypothetical protein
MFSKSRQFRETKAALSAALAERDEYMLHGENAVAERNEAIRERDDAISGKLDRLPGNLQRAP